MSKTDTAENTTYYSSTVKPQEPIKSYHHNKLDKLRNKYGRGGISQKSQTVSNFLKILLLIRRRENGRVKH